MIDTETKPKPIQMSAWSVSRILDGAKTETRRKVPDHLQVADNAVQSGSAFAFVRGPTDQEEVDLIEEVTLHDPGDRLYVREPVYRGEDDYAYYEADDERVIVATNLDPLEDLLHPEYTGIWNHADWRESWSRDRQPSMFMPKTWSRILLEVTEVDVERLQDIGVEDVIAEGIDHDEIRRMYSERGKSLLPNGGSIETVPDRKWRQAFRWEWEGLHGEGAWDENPWVWVIRFDVVHPQLN